MDFKKIFRENMLLEVHDHRRRVYGKSIISEISDDHLVIGVPMKKRELIDLQEGTVYIFKMTLDDALYYFRSEVLGTKISRDLVFYLISWPQKAERLQRRNFYRIPCTLDISYFVVSSGDSMQEKPDAEKAETKTAQVGNLSGGGLLLIADEKLSEGTVLQMHLFLRSKKKRKKVTVKGKIVRVQPFRLGKTVRYRYGVKFLDLEEKRRDEIIHYIFTLSRERLT
ncbi:MAG: hypothetical protein GX996_03255 [Firmicutes bacterium]|nr:hypothetical protein [Bacillota bacterium]